MKANARLLSAMTFSTIFHQGIAQTPQLLEDWWHQKNVPTVHTAVVDSSTNTLYLGHSTYAGFSWYSPTKDTRYGFVADLTAPGWPQLQHDSPNNAVYAVVSDGSGGWFIGGAFSTIGGVSRQRLARLNANGTLDQSWGLNAGVQGIVNTLAIHNDTLYVGGSFTSAGGAPEANNVAAFGVNSGEILEWSLGPDLGTNGPVSAMAVGDGAVYIAGSFTTAGGLAHQHLAALDPVTGGVLPWSPATPGTINTLAYSGGVVYVGGSFTAMNSTERYRIAAINANDGSLTPWNPGGDDVYNIHSIAVSGDTVYVGGAFTSIGGASRTRFAALDRLTNTNNALPSGYADFNNVVRHIEVRGNLVYVSGSFNQITPPSGIDQYRSGAAAIDRSTGEPTNWNPSSQAGVETDAFAVGNFSAYIANTSGVVHRRIGVAALDMTTGRPTGWRSQIDESLPQNSMFNGDVNSMAIKGDTLFVAGTFTQVDGVTRNRAAAFHKITGELLNWQCDVNGPVNSIAVVGNRLYLGGDFTLVNGVVKNQLAAVFTANGYVDATWQTDLTGSTFYHTIKVLHVYAGKLYVGGAFSLIGSQSRANIASVDVVTGDVFPFSLTFANTNPLVRAIETSGDTIFIGGAFGEINGLQRYSLAAVLESNSMVLPNWICNDPSGSPILDLELQGGVLYVANPEELNGQEVDGLGVVNASTGAVLSNWNPLVAGATGLGALDMSIDNIIRTGDLLIALGQFASVQGSSRERIAVWSGLGAFEDISTGLASPNSELSPVRLTPNPTKSIITVFLPENLKVRELSVLDATGRVVLVQTTTTSSAPVSIDLSKHEAGLYFVQVTFVDGTRAVERVVKE